MKINLHRLISATLFLLVADQALAELGGDAASVETDRAHMKAAVMRALPAQKYTVHELQGTSGQVIREYVSPAGTVFAVAWNGPQMPDLRQLFGAYFSVYQQAAKTKRAGRGPLHINQSDLVVHSGGHMRAFSGLAYVPQLVPQDVAISEIK
jgi:hypothetical protein